LKGISPKLAVVMIGINNLSNTVSDVAAGITAVVQRLRNDYPGINVLLLGILPGAQVTATSVYRQEIDQINKLIEPLADGKQVWFLDVGSQFVNPDGSLNESLYQTGNIHPNGEGYAVLAQAIAPWVQVLA
jgi:beta-glucosidase